MHKLFNKITILLASMLLTSCGSYIFPEFYISEIKHDDTVITIVLSEKPNQNLFRESFSFSEDKTTINGDFKFNDNEVNFYPTEKISDFHDYVIEINTGAEDINGISLKTNFHFEFSTKTDHINPTIISITPKDEEIINTDLNLIIISFSEKVDKESFKSSFSISPSVEYLIEWEENTAKILFQEEIDYNKRFTITISKKLKDLQNNFLLHEFNSVFSYNLPTQLPKFEVKAIHNNSETNLTSGDFLNEFVFSDSEFELTFNHDTEINAIASYIKFSPELKYSISQDTTYPKTKTKIILTETPEWGKKYKLTIEKGIKDVYSQEIDESTEYNICFNNQDNKPINFIACYLPTTDTQLPDGYFCAKESNTYSSIILKNENSNTQIDATLYLILETSTSDNNSIDLLSVMEGFSISTTNNCVSYSILTAKILDETEKNSIATQAIKDVALTKPNYVVIAYGISYDYENKKGAIIINIKKKIKDKFGNTLKQDISLINNRI